jgi:P-type E1-E2 ATPase
MIGLDVPGAGSLRLHHLVLDVNGTLALDGALLPGVAERLAALRQDLEVLLITADTHGGQTTIDAALGLTALRLVRGRPEAEQKAALVREIGPESVVAIGNGENDVLMLREARLGIAVLGEEGLATAALNAADVLASSIVSALDLLLDPQRLVATLRR